jgi:hypothetical protein
MLTVTVGMSMSGMLFSLSFENATRPDSVNNKNRIVVATGLRIAQLEILFTARHHF